MRSGARRGAAGAEPMLPGRERAPDAPARPRRPRSRAPRGGSPLDFLLGLLRRHLCRAAAVAKMKDKPRPPLVSFKGHRSLGVEPECE